MSDRLAVFNQGRVEQIGTPQEIYEHPATPFVAGFVGTSNLIEPPLASEIADIEQPFTVRPERIRFLDDAAAGGDGLCIVEGVVEDVQYLGASTRYEVSVAGGARLIVIRQNDEGGMGARPATQAPVRLAFERAAMQVMAGETAEE